MILLRLAARSILNRWLTALLTVLAVAASVILLLGVEKVRTGARDSFANTITDTDLIMGARAGDVQLLLYSVFRVGNAIANVTWESYQDIASRPEVAWIVPLSLGDSHKGFRVLGTDNGYFDHYRYRHGQGLAFTAGGPFSDLFDTIIGAEVAERLGYKLGDPLVVSHGIGDVSFADHADKPFHVSGILDRTGTPVDRTVHISLEALEAIHVDWRGGSRLPGPGVSVDEVRRMELSHGQVRGQPDGHRPRPGRLPNRRRDGGALRTAVVDVPASRLRLRLARETEGACNGGAGSSIAPPWSLRIEASSPPPGWASSAWAAPRRWSIVRTNTTSGRGPSPLREPIRVSVVLALSLTLASCVAPPPQPPAGAINPSRQVAATPASARASVEAKLRELGFTVRGDNDAALTIAAEHVGAPDPAWATCPLAVANDPNSEHNRRSTERPIGMRTTVVVRFTRPGADTIVSVDVIHVGRYQNPYVALEFDEVCRTNGGLEHLLLAAAS